MPDQQIAATRGMGAYRTSTQIDRQTGKPMEIDAIFGRPLAVAKQRQRAVPIIAVSPCFAGTPKSRNEAISRFASELWGLY
jgi:hypothetical protein